MPLQRFIPSSSDRYISNDKNQGAVKFGHLNAVVDYINDNSVKPAGLNGQIQFNDNGALGASADLSWNSTNTGLYVTGTAANLVVYNTNETYNVNNPAYDFVWGTSRTLRVAGNGIFIDNFDDTQDTALSFGAGQASKISFYYHLVGGLPGLTMRNNYAANTMMRWNRANNYLSINNYDIKAQLYVRSSGSTSATTSLLVQNSSGNSVLKVDDNQYVTVQNVTNSECFQVRGANDDATIRFTPSGGTSNIVLRSQSSSITLSTTANAYGDLRVNAPGQTLRIGTSSLVGGGVNYYASFNGGAHSHRWFTNNVEQMTLLHTGALGIGTTTPTKTLSVSNPSGNDADMILKANAWSGLSTLYFGDDASDNVGYIMYRHQFNLIRFSANSSPLGEWNSTGLAINMDTAVTPNSAKLQVKGSGSTSATTSLLVQNSSGTAAMTIKDDRSTNLNGGLYINTGITGGSYLVYVRSDFPNVELFTITENQNMYLGAYSTALRPNGTWYSQGQYGTNFFANNWYPQGDERIGWNFGGNALGATGANSQISLMRINPSIGNFTTGTTNEGNSLLISPTINQVNTGNHTIRGIYYNPTLTSLINTTHYGIQTTSGGAYINTATPDASAALQADSTTQGFLPPRMTTAQKLAIATPAAGLQVYDSTLNQMSYYNGSSWINF